MIKHLNVHLSSPPKTKLPNNPTNQDMYYLGNDFYNYLFNSLTKENISDLLSFWQPNIDAIIITGLPSAFRNTTKHTAISPDTLSLFCIRQDKDVSTDVILLDDIIAKLDNVTIETLLEPIFSIERPASFDVISCSTNRSILSFDSQGNYIINFDIHRVSSNTEIEKEALKKFILATMDPDIIRRC